MKIVTYMGQEFRVPHWSCYIAADEIGDVHVYDKVPEWDEFFGVYVPLAVSMSGPSYVGFIDDIGVAIPEVQSC